MSGSHHPHPRFCTRALPTYSIGACAPQSLRLPGTSPAARNWNGHKSASVSSSLSGPRGRRRLRLGGPSFLGHVSSQEGPWLVVLVTLASCGADSSGGTLRLKLDSTIRNYDTGTSFISTPRLGSMYRLSATFYTKYSLLRQSQSLVDNYLLLVMSRTGDRLLKTKTTISCRIAGLRLHSLVQVQHSQRAAESSKSANHHYR